MLIKTLKTNKPFAFIVFFVSALLLYIIDLIVTPPLYISFEHPIFSSWAQFFVSYPWLSYTAVFVIGLLLAMGWNNLLTDRGVFKNVTILPAYIFVILSSGFNLSSLWICSFIMLFVLNKLMSTYQHQKPFAHLYDSGFLIGLSFLIYPPSLVFFLVVLFSNAIYTALEWRNFVIPILGLFTPLLFGATLGYFFDKLELLFNFYLSSFDFQNFSIEWTTELITWVSLVGLIFLLSFKEMLLWLSMKNLRSRKSFYLLFVYSWCVFLSLFMAPNTFNHLLFLVLPLSVIIANYFMFLQKKWWYEGAIIVLILCTIYLHIAPHI